jgi:hypothetical protein
MVGSRGFRHLSVKAAGDPFRWNVEELESDPFPNATQHMMDT